MSYGLRCFSSSGQTTLDTDSFLTRYLTTVTIRGSRDYSPFPNTGSVNVPELAGVTRFWYTVYRTYDPLTLYVNWGYGPFWVYLMPTVSISGTTVSWYYFENGVNAYNYAGATVVIGAY
jgi:hypothetical protein